VVNETRYPVLRTFIVRVENEPGVLNRVASLFRRRGFNIESVTIGLTEQAGVSRMTIVTETDGPGAHRVESNLRKLVNVLSVDTAFDGALVSRDLAMIKVAADMQSRPHITRIAQTFRAHVVDVTPCSLVLEVSGSEATIDSLLDLLRPFGIIEMARTGRLAMRRGAEAVGAAGELAFGAGARGHQRAELARSA